MRPSAIKRIKKPYRLWYEYLKRSENYEKFCSTMRAGKSSGETAENTKLHDVYFSWGDVFEDSFGESYKRFKLRRPPQKRRAVLDFKTAFRSWAMKIIENYELETGSEISVPELIDRIERNFKRQTLVFMIDPTLGTNDKILAEVKGALEKKRREPATRGLQLMECVNNRLTTDAPRIELLRNCLITFDLMKAGMRVAQVIEACRPKEHGDFKHSVKRYNLIAKKIIENVEQGFFPGEYPLPPDEQQYEYGVLVGQGPQVKPPADATPVSPKKKRRRS